ncbi:MAG: TetR/AcrR family transcriptional regulator [Solidesulfovibrio sp. DCME]|uniref:TetR/AcrR family transcriptional regulator n=1 Tax=Solidesulfovibrio sp. DCME TaxID=3447380 RepID=UPI003D11A674
MCPSHRKKKQPQLVRSQLLAAAAGIVVARGLAGLTLDLVAREAGLSKGGLIHHFPSKQALIEGLFLEMLAAFEAGLAAAADHVPTSRRRFTRAYVAAILTPCFGAFDGKLLGACALALCHDPAITGLWEGWLARQFSAYGEDPADVAGRLIRYAADGMWLEMATEQAGCLPEDRRAVVARLLDLADTL